MEAIQGKIRILLLRRPGQSAYRRVGFLVVNSWQKSTDFLPTTTRANRGYKTERPVGKSATIGFSCVLFDGTYSDRFTYKELSEIQDNDELVDWKLEASGKGYLQIGKGYLSRLNESAPYNEVVQFDATINVFGQWYDLTDNVPPTRPVLTIFGHWNDALHLSWSASKDDKAVVGYEMERTTAYGVSLFQINNSRIFQDKGVLPGRTITYRIRAYDAAGNRSDFSLPKAFTFPSSDNSYLLQQDSQGILTESGELIEI